MKLHSFGKLFSLVAVLALVIALACAMAVTAGAETVDLAAVGNVDTLENLEATSYKECGKVKLTWDEIDGAVKYAVYRDDELANHSIADYYILSGHEIAADGEEPITYTYTVVALDADDVVLATATITAAAEHVYFPGTPVAPTCTEDGYTVYTCNHGKSYQADIVEKLGHAPNEAVVENTVYPTCVLDGNHDEVVYCGRCDAELSRENVVDAKLGHELLSENWNERVEPDCVNTGVVGYYTCTRCPLHFDAEGEVIDNLVIPALGHEFLEDAYVSNNDATCLLDGTKTAQCSRCEVTNTLTDADTKLGHEFLESAYVYNNDAVCEVDGTKTAQCSRCDATDTVVAEGTALSHIYTNYVSDGNATCLEDGTKTAACDNGCGKTDTQTDVDSALGHSFTNYISNGDATCLLDGTETAECDNGCGETHTQTEVDSALGHSFTNYVSNGDDTCTEDGTETAECGNGCGETHTQTEVGSARGHSFTNYVSNGDATCTEDGTETAECDNGCGETHTQTEVGSMLEHTNGDVTVENEVLPDCNNEGRYDNVVYCTVCGTKVSSEHVTVDKLGHNEGEWIVDTDPTCNSMGSKHTECTRCGEEMNSDLIPKLIHSYTNYVSNGDATCTANGTETATCDNGCGKTKTRTDDDSMLPHTEGEVVVENNVLPDCLNDGSYDNVVYCTVCENEVSREHVTVEALGHTTHTVVENNVLPDCTNVGGYDNVAYCTVCEAEVSREHVTVDALGHVESEWITDVEPTCTTDGRKYTECTRCDVELKSEVINKLGHKFNSYTSDNNATCTEDGTKTAKCANGCGLTDTKADEGSKLGHNYVLADDPDAVTVYDVCSNCGDQQAVKKQIPQYILKPLIKVLVVAACLLVVVLCVGALRSPATTTPWYKRRRYR